MAVSHTYTTTFARIHQLEAHLLPPINPMGTYTDKDQDLLRAYCLLCHAEFEAYLEGITLQVVTRAYNKWLTDKSVISPIIFQLAYNFASKIKDVPYSLVVKSYLEYKKSIEGNHGIKENNLSNFFRPIGFEMDSLLKATLHNFGGARGEIAHTSFSTQQPLDPATEKANVVQILNGLRLFDDELDVYESLGTLSRSPKSMQWSKFNLLQRIKILFTGQT
ncbi:HEPN domain-containing protein [Daejeonella oryzae]|uniref:HEPN domain-containing protein n=1 Tax=Daejeonella oryzae TaxID=1122943 RepID=UPI0003FAED6A|nr:HEPN domain-containing protein [Daejeonella oryzae]